MASPQVEDGYTKLSNELLEAIIDAGFTRREYTIVLYLIRQTYGYHRKKSYVKIKDVCDATSMDFSDICKTLKELVRKKIVKQEKHGRFYTYSIKKDYEQWLIPEWANKGG
jgi:phage replication O-like protein O